MDAVARVLGGSLIFLLRVALIIVHAVLSGAVQSAAALWRGARSEWAEFRSKDGSGLP